MTLNYVKTTFTKYFYDHQSYFLTRTKFLKTIFSNIHLQNAHKKKLTYISFRHSSLYILMFTGYHYTEKMLKILYSGLMGLFDGHHCEEHGRCWMTADKADYQKRTL